MEQKAKIHQSYVGWEGLSELASILAAVKPSSICLFTGKASFDEHPLKAKLLSILEKYQVTHIRAEGSNPQIEDIERRIPELRNICPELVLAIGGGSVLDLAKLVTFFTHLGGGVQSYLDRVSEGPVPIEATALPTVVAIPTTAGTGSEATQFATFYKQTVKCSLDHPAVLPDYAIVDPGFSSTGPAYLTACCGMDALTQAVESYWAIKATPASSEKAAVALQLILANIESAVLNPSPASRLGMAKGAFLAGQAIQITRTTAAHALSYPLTALFGIPHGQAVGMLLPYFMEFNAKVTASTCNDSRGEVYVQGRLQDLVRAFTCDNATAVKKALKSLQAKIGLTATLSDFGVTKADFVEILEKGFNPARVSNNPRMFDYESAKSILNDCF